MRSWNGQTPAYRGRLRGEAEETKTVHSCLELEGGERGCPGAAETFLLRETETKEGGKDASVLQREVGGGGAADCGHPPGGLQLPQADALSGAHRPFHGR